MDRRERLIAVFEDTQAYYTENRRLADAVQRGKAAVKLYAVAIEEYRRSFDLIEFAIYCRKWESENYNAFKAWCK